jgi:hypothetical protein
VGDADSFFISLNLANGLLSRDLDGQIITVALVKLFVSSSFFRYLFFLCSAALDVHFGKARSMRLDARKFALVEQIKAVALLASA